MESCVSEADDTFPTIRTEQGGGSCTAGTASVREKVYKGFTIQGVNLGLGGWPQGRGQLPLSPISCVFKF